MACISASRRARSSRGRRSTSSMYRQSKPSGWPTTGTAGSATGGHSHAAGSRGLPRPGAAPRAATDQPVHAEPADLGEAVRGALAHGGRGSAAQAQARLEVHHPRVIERIWRLSDASPGGAGGGGVATRGARCPRSVSPSPRASPWAAGPSSVPSRVLVKAGLGPQHSPEVTAAQLCVDRDQLRGQPRVREPADGARLNGDHGEGLYALAAPGGAGRARPRWPARLLVAKERH